MTQPVKKTWVAQIVLKAISNANPMDCITTAQLINLTKLKPRQVEKAVFTLMRHDLLSRSARGCCIVTDAGREAINHGTRLNSGPYGIQSGHRVYNKPLRERIWRAIRIRRKFSVPEIIGLVADDSECGDVSNVVRKYILVLRKAGYLIELPRREPGASPFSNGYKRWYLADDKNTGPIPPTWNGPKKTVYDPNTEVTHDISGGAA